MTFTRRAFAALAASVMIAMPAAAQDTAEAPAEITIPDMVMGAEDAPIQIVEYASYTCPHCAHFHDDQFQKLQADYIETGKVRFIHREAVFDRPGLWATMIARCGGEMRYWGISGLIYEKQADWIGDRQLAGIADRLRKLGLTAGLTAEQVDACMQDAERAQAYVDWYEANRAADDIEATPTLIINGEKHNNMSYEDLSALLDGLLAQ